MGCINGKFIKDVEKVVVDIKDDKGLKETLTDIATVVEDTLS